MIVPARPEDLAAVAALNHSAYAEMAERVPAWREESFFRERVAERTEAAQFLLLRVDSGFVGAVGFVPPGRSMYPIPSDWASILLLAVDPAHRRRGVARMLAEACLDRARKDEAETVGLFTSELMTSARRLYEDLGFRVERELPARQGLRFWLYRYDFSTSSAA